MEESVAKASNLPDTRGSSLNIDRSVVQTAELQDLGAEDITKERQGYDEVDICFLISDTTTPTPHLIISQASHRSSINGMNVSVCRNRARRTNSGSDRRAKFRVCCMQPQWAYDISRGLAIVEAHRKWEIL